jgi:hypothetical protein
VGLILLIPGLVFLLNGVEWFPAEDTVGMILAVIGVVILVVQLVFMAVAGRMVKKSRASFRRDFF